MIGWIRSLFSHSPGDAELVQQATDAAAKSEATLRDSTRTMKALGRARTIADDFDLAEKERIRHAQRPAD